MSKAFAIFGVSILLATAAPAQVPETISFQGRLTDSGGTPIDSSDVGMTFKLYSIFGGGAFWTESQSVDVTDGAFDVRLGAASPLDSVIFYSPVELGIKLDGAASEMTPRTPLESAPFALGMRGMYVRWAEDDSNNRGYNIVGGDVDNTIGVGTVGATIGGGGGDYYGSNFNNSVDGDFGTIGGGAGNEVTGQYGTVSGGRDGTAAEGATVGGGLLNSADGLYATVSGGFWNLASGQEATVCGGFVNVASGHQSFAAGTYARARNDGSFVWQDATAEDAEDTLTTAFANQFVARASGGFWFFTDPAPSVATGVYVGAGSGTWNTLSSRASKSKIHKVDTRDYLERLGDVNLNEWSYRTEQGVTHVGPMAEDFYAAFGLGPSDKSISTVDADGVALAAIQGLYEIVKEQQAEIDRLSRALDRAGIGH